jgi:hypothetical protein
MLKTLITISVLYLATYGVSQAACSAETAMTKGSDVSDVLSTKLQTKPDEASKMMSEMGDIMGSGTTTDATCTKLDDLMVRAKKL